MKKWYCPRCETFKRFKKTVTGIEGYPDRHLCRCCNTELLDVKFLLDSRDAQYIRDLAKARKKH